MNNRDLFARLGELGFDLFQGGPDYDANSTLADVVKSHDPRLWDGFPVVLANSSEKGLFNYEKTKSFLKKESDKTYLDALAALSLALYDTLGMCFSWHDILYRSLGPSGRKAHEKFKVVMKKGRDLEVGKVVVSCQRLMATFENYFRKRAPALSELLLKREELGLEHSMAQIFSPKQREIFLKRLKGEKLTKTETEYYSRVVKKKVAALANTELHRLARRLLEQ